MRVILLAACALVLSACGTIKSKDYTDLAIQKAQLEAQVEAHQHDEAQTQALLEQLKFLFEMWSSERRPHSPGKH